MGTEYIVFVGVLGTEKPRALCGPHSHDSFTPTVLCVCWVRHPCSQFRAWTPVVWHAYLWWQTQRQQKGWRCEYTHGHDATVQQCTHHTAGVMSQKLENSSTWAGMMLWTRHCFLCVFYPHYLQISLNVSRSSAPFCPGESCPVAQTEQLDVVFLLSFGATCTQTQGCQEAQRGAFGSPLVVGVFLVCLQFSAQYKVDMSAPSVAYLFVGLT